MTRSDLSDLHGLPLETAMEILNQKNIPYRVIEYDAPRGPLGPDRRVLRAVGTDDVAELVVSGFCTVTDGEHCDK